jgi:sigma-E factor negative regulatory protein RseA
MNERIGESLSALMDDAANELELARVLSQLSSDPKMRQSWLRYNLANHALHGDQLAHLDLDISKSVQAALEGAPLESPASAHAGFKQRLLRPLISFGVAASVALTVVVGGQQLAVLDANSLDAERSFAENASPVGLVNITGAVPLQANYGMQSIPLKPSATASAYDELAQQRLHRYMQEHAEQAALNSPQGLVPFARVPEICEQD